MNARRALSERALISWAMVGVPAIVFAVIILANLTVPTGHPPLLGGREPLFYIFSIALLGSGTFAVTKLKVLGSARWVAALVYAVVMGTALVYVGAGVSILMGDIG